MASTGEVQPAQPSLSVLEMLRLPRVTLGLLAAWAVLAVVAEVLSDSFLFNMNKEASGILGGRVFSASAIIPAIVYIWALRDPQRHRPVFWLGLIEQVAVILSSFYHKGAGDVTWAGVVVPSIISGALIFLIFPNLFQARAAAVPQPVGSLPSSSRR